jgi:hypothetical protein
MGLQVNWSESDRALTLRLAQGSRMLPPARREIQVKLMPSGATEQVAFDGKPLELKL